MAAKKKSPKQKSLESTEANLFSDQEDKVGRFPAPDLPPGWMKVLQDEFKKPYFQSLLEYVAEERSKHEVFPPEEDVFRAFKTTDYPEVKVLILGQDPYHNPGEAHGLSFSVQPGVTFPPSLRNIFKELKDDLGCKIPNNGYLLPWAQQGVMLLNAVLTVRKNSPTSHKNQGWETFTDEAIHQLSNRDDPVIFLLWGAYAQKKKKLIDTNKHIIIESAHPSPLSAKNGFFGSKPFSKINAALKTLKLKEIDWQIPDV
jgi:uracil-DNA glycosylase